MVLTVMDYEEFYSIMIAYVNHQRMHFIAYVKNQFTIHYLCIAEINCNNNSMSYYIPMCHYVKNLFKHSITWF